MSAASAARILTPGVMTWSPTDRVAQPAKPLSVVRTLHSDGLGPADPLHLRRTWRFPPNLAEELQGDAASA